MIEDYDLIEASFAKQYGIRLRETEMSWDEFCTLLAGIMPDTPLGNIVTIRSENNPTTLKHFTSDQKRIRNEWRKNMAVNVSKTEYEQAMKGFSEMFKGMAKGGGDK